METAIVQIIKATCENSKQCHECAVSHLCGILFDVVTPADLTVEELLQKIYEL